MNIKKMSTMLLIMLMICCISINIFAKDKLVAGMDPHGVPWAYIDETGKPAGFTVEAIDWIAEEMGFEVEHKPISWDAIISTLLAGQLDFIGSGMTITEERLKVVDFTIPYMQIDQAVCVREDSDINMIEALCGKYQVGTQRGATAAMWIEDNLVKKGVLNKDKVSLFEGFDLAVESLMSGRIQSAMMDDVMLAASIHGKPLKIIGTLITGEVYGYAVRKEDKDLKAMLDEGLTRLMKSGRWNELKEKYIVGISK